MKVFKRTVETKNNADYDYAQHTQAALNSNGQITIRNYSNSTNEEAMLVLTVAETRAVFELMRQFKSLTGGNLPF